MEPVLTALPFPLTFRTAERMSDEDLIAFSRQNKGYRIERTAAGEISIMTPVGGIGSTHEAFVFGSLYMWAISDGRGLPFGTSAGFNLRDGSCLSPDAAWLSLDRWNALTEAQQVSFPPLCPEFVIEIRSASDARRLLEIKMELWLENGAQLAWLLDPLDGEAVIYRPDQHPERLHRPATLPADPPLYGFELNTSRLWSSQPVPNV